MSSVSSPRDRSAPTVIEGIEFPAGLDVSWDTQQLHFKRGQKHVTDALMARILRHEKSKELQSVDLGLCFKITDLTLSMLADIATLRYLNFAGCFNITDRGVIALSKLPSLNNLILYRCQRITDASVKAISTAKYRLFLLSLSHCYEITNEGLAEISQQSNLVELDLTYTKVTDHVAKHLSGLTNLVRLILYYCTGITKGALPTLCALPNLVEINCRYTRVTKGHGVVFYGNGGKTKIIAGDK